MQSKRDEWVALRGALGVAVVCAIAAAAMLLTSDYLWREADREYQTHFAAFREASRRYLAVADEEKIIEAQYPLFKALFAGGLLGDEHRLTWVEVLQRAGRELDLHNLEYRVDPQTRYTPEVPLNTAPFDLFFSAMHIKVGLRHEGELLNILHRLEQDGEGLFSVERCELLRQASGDVEANLAAECSLRWFTLDMPGDAKLTL